MKTIFHSLAYNVMVQHSSTISLRAVLQSIQKKKKIQILRYNIVRVENASECKILPNTFQISLMFVARRFNIL